MLVKISTFLRSTFLNWEGITKYLMSTQTIPRESRVENHTNGGGHSVSVKEPRDGGGEGKHRKHLGSEGATDRKSLRNPSLHELLFLVIKAKRT